MSPSNSKTDGPPRPPVADGAAPPPRRFIVHSPAHVRAALAAAAETGVEVVLATPVAGVRSLGVGYFQTMIAEGRGAARDARFTAILDCGDAPGLALAALRAGVTTVRVGAAPEIHAKLAEIARQHGGAIDTGPADGLDLAYAADPLAAARSFLNAGHADERD